MPTHADVAHRFAQYINAGSSRSLKGSRMDTSCTFPPDPMRSYPDAGLFQSIAFGFSYSTCVARIVRNTYTNKLELWLSQNRYSQSTDRHRSMYRAAYNARCRELGLDIQHYKFAAGSHSSRHNPERAGIALTRFVTSMNHAARHGSHAATRVNALEHAIETIDKTLRHMTEGIPAEVVAQSAETIDTLTHYRATATTMLVTPERIKAAALGWLALNDYPPPQP